MSNYKLFPTMYISHIAQYLELKNIIQTSAFNTTERSTSQFIWKKKELHFRLLPNAPTLSPVDFFSLCQKY